jgi:hypothetical protein
MIPETQNSVKSDGRSSDPMGSGDAAIPPAGTTRPRRRRRRSLESSRRALAMLSLLPVHALPVPKVHVEPRRPDGTIAVFDRPTGTQLIVYTPRFDRQFRAGHRSGSWYVRPLLELGSEPVSPDFPTAKAAIDAVAQDRWRKGVRPSSMGGPVIRVIWPASECPGHSATDQASLVQKCPVPGECGPRRD